MPATPDRIGFITNEFRTSVASDPAVKAKYGEAARDSGEEIVETFFDDPADAAVMAGERLLLLSADCRRFRQEINEAISLSGSLDVSQITPTIRVVDQERSADFYASLVEAVVDLGSDRSTIVSWGAPFSPASLFVSGEQGGVYDPSTLGEAYQDAAGATAAAVDASLGLLLDNRFGLTVGPELLSNGGFDSAAGWSLGSGWSIGGGVASATATASGSLYQASGGGYTPTKSFLVQFFKTGTSAMDLYLRSGPVASVAGAVTGLVRRIMRAGTNAALGIEFYAGVSSATTLDDVSIKEIAGNPARQTNAASRPVLRYRNGKYRLDGGALIAHFPVSLGSACTVVYMSDAAVMTLTNQTIGTSYDIIRAQYTGRVFIINRALSAKELAQVQRWVGSA